MFLPPYIAVPQCCVLQLASEVNLSFHPVLMCLLENVQACTFTVPFSQIQHPPPHTSCLLFSACSVAFILSPHGRLTVSCILLPTFSSILIAPIPPSRSFSLPTPPLACCVLVLEYSLCLPSSVGFADVGTGC